MDQVREVQKRYKKIPKVSKTLRISICILDILTSKYVILVGGFGRSQYLYHCVQKAIGEQIELLQGSGSKP